jgi:N-carbamoylputrescine amidase
MRVTVCELPHEPEALLRSWTALCQHTTEQHSELVLLPEFVFVEPVWQKKRFAVADWSKAETRSREWLERLPELGAQFVIGTRPVSQDGHHYNEGFLWSAAGGAVALRRKYFLPDEPGFWEARWFARGHAEFPEYTAGGLRFGLNICTELWALETYAGYAALGVRAILAPRGTPAASIDTWLSMGTVAAVRAGAFCISSNRVQANGSAGGMGWIIDPGGELLAMTSHHEPFCTLDLDMELAVRAQLTYPRYVFQPGR